MYLYQLLLWHVWMQHDLQHWVKIKKPFSIMVGVFDGTTLYVFVHVGPFETHG